MQWRLELLVIGFFKVEPNPVLTRVCLLVRTNALLDVVVYGVPCCTTHKHDLLLAWLVLSALGVMNRQSFSL